MNSEAFVPTTAIPTRTVIARKSTCSFIARQVVPSTVRSSRALFTMINAPTDYSGLNESEGDDDGGDGFLGKSDMDDLLGVSMPDDLAGFERRAIMESKNREDLVEKLKGIRDRRRDVLDDRRRGMGMDNVGNYLDQL